ncbi:hypothetical protein P3S67_030874 [Capsicum chacoense]
MQKLIIFGYVLNRNRNWLSLQFPPRGAPKQRTFVIQDNKEASSSFLHTFCYLYSFCESRSSSSLFSGIASSRGF